MGTYTKKKYYGSTCHIYTFNPSVERLDATIGIPGKLEKLSKITGEPKTGEVTTAKINGGFFNMNGSTEFIGTYVDEGLYYNPSQEFYPTLVYDKTNKMFIEMNPNQNRLVWYQYNANFAIGVPWTLIIDGKINYSYPTKTLQAVFGHFNAKAPRTLLGQKADGTIVMVVVDGRKLSSPGYTGATSAQLMLDLGCKIAVNLDGGGSSEMIVNNSIKNKPSDGCERSVGTAFVTYTKINPQPLENGPIPNGSVATTKYALNLRRGPSTGYATICTMAAKSKVTINGYTNGWYNVTFGNKTGYCSGSYLTAVTAPPATPVKKGKIVPPCGLNIRNRPSTGGKKITAYAAGTVVTIYGEEGDWYRVGDGLWAAKKYIQIL